ncbi:MAG: hypothetical protein H0X64_06875 [Gemmatimonadaceae bacterium]|nr:hypothetical protein [Gemmatimonadaceae bacterium]
MIPRIPARRARPVACRGIAVLAATLLLVADTTSLGAQAPASPHSRAPYSSLTVSVAASRQASSGRLDDYWDAGRGVRIDIHTPFYLGDAGLTATTLRYATRTASQPGFRAIVAGANWRFPIGTTARLRPALSVEAGNFMTIFDGDQPKGLGKESEIYAGGGASLGVAIAAGTAAVFGADARHVFTSTPIRMVSLHAGIAHTFATPGWLRAVIE